ncbi:MAG: hypothetical protein ABS76_33600 [Pelagibacterium sp. SCN 64-44]|nr:MAG: hypothetical protein ABS76_33600 [Pelagibacterium sp. SCN 64-44]
MTKTIYMPALGNMGAALARQLTANGLRVTSTLDGRSADTRKRAAEAGVENLPAASMMQADIVLSVAPPEHAVSIARQFSALGRPSGRLVYADMNAVSPDTARQIGTIVTNAGAEFVDGGIIGLPPSPGKRPPVLYVAGPEAGNLLDLNAHGLQVALLDGPIGAASALKLSYAGITKGLIAMAAAMMLTASRSGVAPALAVELKHSQPQLMDSFSRSVPDMMPKAARWVSEMKEIAAFAGDGFSINRIYDALAGFYRAVGRDYADGGEGSEALRSFLTLAADQTSEQDTRS